DGDMRRCADLQAAEIRLLHIGVDPDGIRVVIDKEARAGRNILAGIDECGVDDTGKTYVDLAWPTSTRWRSRSATRADFCASSTAICRSSTPISASSAFVTARLALAVTTPAAAECSCCSAR